MKETADAIRRHLDRFIKISSVTKYCVRAVERETVLQIHSWDRRKIIIMWTIDVYRWYMKTEKVKDSLCYERQST